MPYTASIFLSASAMPPMMHYPSVAGRNAPAVNAALDISSTVFATLTAASQFAPLPFLQEASILALAILTTVRSAKDNKEAFKNLANDACELVSAIVCVYKDMEKDGQTPSLGLKKRVEDLIGLLHTINLFAQKHASKGTMYRMVRLKTDTDKIQQYRGKLRQALDVFGLQSTISIHENVVEILKELRERELREQQQRSVESESETASPPPTPAPASPFGNLFSGSGTIENIKINYISGNQEFHSTNHYTNVVDSFNHRSFHSANPPRHEFEV
ncbi:hypothetical protein C8R43DRAFT_982402 [Mycena crocata]|nr:hypothetical protein C8R43DRAFT_982402 [Mycena crocata]